MTEPKPVTSAEIAAKERGMLSELGGALGLNEEFTADVCDRRQVAIIERAQMIDQNGAQGRILAMTQVLGMWMQEKLERAEFPSMGAIGDAIILIAKQYGVDGGQALMLLGSALEVYQQAAGRIIRTENDNAGSGTSTTRP